MSQVSLSQDLVEDLAAKGSITAEDVLALRRAVFRDGVVDLADFALLRDNFGGKFPPDESFSKGDFDTNTRVDLKDFAGFRKVFNEQGVAAAVPEPCTFSLLGLAGVALFTLRRRR